MAVFVLDVCLYQKPRQEGTLYFTLVPVPVCGPVLVPALRLSQLSLALNKAEL